MEVDADGEVITGYIVADNYFELYVNGKLVARKPPCEDRCYAVRYPIPQNWASPSFDDTRWPRAYEYTDEDVGVTNLPAYTRYPELFEGARWIWSINLVLDNLVIARKTVR